MLHLYACDPELVVSGCGGWSVIFLFPLSWGKFVASLEIPRWKHLIFIPLMLSVSPSWLSTHDFYPFLYESNKHIYNEADSWTESISKCSPGWLPTMQSSLSPWQIHISPVITGNLAASCPGYTFHSDPRTVVTGLPSSDFFDISSQIPRDVYQVA